MSLAEALEAAASALVGDADAIRPANGDPTQLLRNLDPQGAARVAAWLLAERPDDADELTEVWAESDEGVAALLAVDEAALPKPGRKKLRRAVHRLRSQGIAVERPAPAPRVATVASVEEELEGALLSPLDPAGGRVAYLMEAHPSGGARIFEVLLDDARGVLSLEVYSASRSKARRFFRDLTARDRFPAVEVEPDDVRAVVAHAATAQSAERPLPRGFGEWRGRIARTRGEGMLPGARVVSALASGAAGSLEAAAKLVEQGRIGPWPPEPEVLMALVERLRTAADSPLIVSGDTKRGQLDDLVADAAEEIFHEAGRVLVAHRLRESAYCLWRADDEEAARACLAAADAFEGSEPIRDNPVARALLTIPLQPYLTSSEAAEPGADAPPDHGGSPILTP